MTDEVSYVATIPHFCPICLLPLNTVTLMRKGNIYHTETYPEATFEITDCIYYWKNKIPNPRVELDKTHIHFNIININDPDNIGKAGRIEFYKQGQLCEDNISESDAIYLHLHPGLDEQLEEIIIFLLLQTTFPLQNQVEYGNNSGEHEKNLVTMAEELLEQHGSYFSYQYKSPSYHEQGS